MATSYYNLLDKLKEKLEENISINTVREGSVFDAANDKTTIYPLSIVDIESSRLVGNVFRYTVELICMDILDVSNLPALDKFVGNDNKQDIHNTQHAAINSVLIWLGNREAAELGYALVGEPEAIKFTSRFDNNDTAGWRCTFEIDVLIDYCS